MHQEDLDKKTTQTNSQILAGPMAEVHQTENVDVESSTSTSTTSTTKSAVERKKITSGTGVGRRKLTPHPLNPNNVMGSQVQ